MHQSIRPENKDARLTKGGLEQKEQTDKREPPKETIEQPKIEPKKSKPEDKPKQTAPKGEQKAEESKPEPVKMQPDISARLVYKKAFAILLFNSSVERIIVRDPRYSIVIIDLDLSDQEDVIQQTKSFDGTWIRQREGLGPFHFADLPEVAALIKPGHRLLGWMNVTCRDCIRTKS